MFAAAAFLLALGLILYPLIAAKYNEVHQSAIYAEYAQIVEQKDDSEKERILKLARQYNEALKPGVQEAHSRDLLLWASEDYADQLNIARNGIMGYIDTDRLQTLVVQNMSSEERARLQRVEDLMYEIEEKMTDAGLDSQRVKEAQVLYVLALSDFSEEAGFVDKLVGCFSDGQTDAQLIAAVNAAFGTNLSAEDFTKVMSAIRAAYISTAGYVDPSTKNNLDLVEWTKNAYAKGWGYVWGTYGQVLTRSLYDAKAEQYPDEVGGYADFIKEHWVGGRTADCVGLIKGYGWLDGETMEIQYGSNGMPDIGANEMYYNAVRKGAIQTMPDTPGLAVWKPGHIGVYIGNGEVIEAMGTKYGVVKTQLEGRGWTHWLKIPYINYIEETEEPYEESSDYDYP